MKQRDYDIVVIGGGPAGLAAAIEAKKNGIERILLIEREVELGGVLRQCIHSGFGIHFFKEELTGPEYAQRFINQFESLGIDCLLDTMVLSIDREKNLTLASRQEGYMKIKGKGVILATGCRERTREALRIPGKRLSGIYTAGTAQRYINIDGYLVGKKVVILGSGDIGLIMARRLTLEGSAVLAVVEKQPFSGGLARNVVQCLVDYDIPLLLKHTVTDIVGKHRVEGVILSEVDDQGQVIPGTEKRMACDTLLLSVGLIPERDLFAASNIPLNQDGLFACGNVVQVYTLVDDVTLDGMKTGRNAASYVRSCCNE